MFIFGYPKLLFLITKITFWISKIRTCFGISKIVFSDIWNNYFGYLKKWINVNSACHIKLLRIWNVAVFTWSQSDHFDGQTDGPRPTPTGKKIPAPSRYSNGGRVTITVTSECSGLVVEYRTRNTAFLTDMVGFSSPVITSSDLRRSPAVRMLSIHYDLLLIIT